MSDQELPTQNQPTVSPTQKHSKRPFLALLVVILLVLGVAAAYLTNNDKKASPNKPSTETTTSSNISLALDPASQTVTKGTPFTLSVWVDSGSEQVNAVQADILYPKDKFDFVSIDSVGTAFEIQAQATGGDGKITIARGQIGGVVGKHLVAKVTLTPKVDSGEGSLTFSNESMVANAGKNILSKTTGGEYTIKAAQ